MARILFCEYSNITWTKESIFDAHAESFINALTGMGNKVICINTRFLCKNANDNTPKFFFGDYVEIVKNIKKFNPELIITYNNSVPIDILNSSSCPILVYPADVLTSWSGIQYIRENIERYFFLETTVTITKSIREEIPEVKEEQIIPFGWATGVHAYECEQDINISFVGSLMDYSYEFIDLFYSWGINESANAKKEQFFLEYDKWRENETKFKFDDFLNKIPDNRQNYNAICLAACSERLDILMGLVDLGLKIYGYPISWIRLAAYHIELFKAYDYTRIASLSENENVYNRSIISLNPPQANKTDGFSWRVPDILASNSVLLSVPKKDLKLLMNKYYRDMPFYTSSAEAKELATKLLNEANWRKEIVQASHDIVEKEGRFEPKIMEIFNAIPDIEMETNGQLIHLIDNNTFDKVQEFCNKHQYALKMYNKVKKILR